MLRPETPYRGLKHWVMADRGRFVPKQWTYRARGTPDCLLMLTVSGSGRLAHAHGTHTAQRGDALLLMPGACHDYGAPWDAHWEVLWAHFRPQGEWPQFVQWPELSAGLRLLRCAQREAFAEIVRAMVKVIRRSKGAFTHDRLLARAGLEEVLLLCDRLNPRRKEAALDGRIREAIAYLCARLDRPVAVAEAARACHLSPSRFAHLFRAETGSTVQAFHEAQRLERARQRLALTREPVARIAEDLGFANVFYFSRRFRKAAGISPRAYRARHGR